MKRLILLRHAKAVGEHAGGDQARPLAPRGIQQVQEVAHAFLAKGWQPQLALVSPAERTCQTARLLAASLGKMPLVIDRSLYLATAGQMLASLMAAPEDIDELLLVGHNPGISELATQLADRTAPVHLPTAGYFCHQYDISSWLEIRKQTPPQKNQAH